jgi:GTP pyrophosphokinase
MNQHISHAAPTSAKSDLGATPDVDPDSWLARVTASRTASDAQLLGKALSLLVSSVPAGGQGARPDAIAHGLSIAQILHDLEVDAATVAVGLLTAEIKPTTVDGVKALLGDPVAELAANVERLRTITDVHVAPNDELQTERLRKLLLMMVSDVRAALVVLAERLHAMRTLKVDDVSDARTFGLQTLALFAPLASRLGIWQVKWELEDLALRYTEPATYKDIAKKLAERRVDREKYVDSVVERVRGELKAAGIDADVTGRPKHIYSIWRKMQSKSLDFHELFDVRAVRVITADLTECYAALGIVHGLWQHVPHEFDDYIASPKANRYQSLHTAVIGPGGRTVEVQIRTRGMHNHAERGVAAHWRYKEGASPDQASADDRTAWLRQALEWRAEIADPGRALELLSQEPTDQFVYSLTPQGRVIELPSGATPIDFAYRVHTDVGHRCRGARVDGKLVPLTRTLASGETVEILTARNGAPSRDWLNRDLGYLVTRQARARVRQWFKRQDFAQNATQGRETWERELRRLRLPAVDLSGFPARFNLTDVESLHAALGRGDVHVGQLVRLVQTQLQPDALPPRKRARPDRPRVAPDGISVEGVGELLTQLARCCSPVPPEPIVGYITRGRGVSVHRRQCANARRLNADEPDRILEVSWGTAHSRRYNVEVVVSAYDRRGLLRDVGAVVANDHLDVRAINSVMNEADQTVTMRISLDVEDVTELSRVVSRLLQIRNVFEVSRGG